MLSPRSVSNTSTLAYNLDVPNVTGGTGNNDYTKGLIGLVTPFTGGTLSIGTGVTAWVSLKRRSWEDLVAASDALEEGERLLKAGEFDPFPMSDVIGQSPHAYASASR